MREFSRRQFMVGSVATAAALAAASRVPLAAGNVAALGGRVFVVFEDFPLLRFGNAVPALTAVVRREDGYDRVQFPPMVHADVNEWVVTPASGESHYEYTFNAAYMVPPGAVEVRSLALNGHPVWTYPAKMDPRMSFAGHVPGLLADEL